MLDVFEASELVVLPSSSCCAMVRLHYEKLFADEPVMKLRAQRLAAKTFEFGELLRRRLWDSLAAWRLEYDGAVTYHYSCHLRMLGITDEPVQLLRRIHGLDYRPLVKQDQCCGFGGAFAFRYPSISAAMVADKVACIAATGADTVICSDAGCAMNIAGQCRREGLDIRVRHIAELLDQAMTNGRQDAGGAI
jgi:L-lactate dehydrogenase complex protein LldE